MKMIVGTTAGGSNQQNNIISIRNTEGGYFSHFGMIGANLLGEFGTFENNNNNNLPLENNNNNNLPPLGFGEGLGRGFNLLSGGLGGEFNSPLGGNARGLDPNIVALVNALIEANLGINHVKRESNHVKPIEFRGIEAEDSNKWLE